MTDLWDEHGTEYQGILTYETENAPRRFTIGHQRFTRATETVVNKDEHINKNQLKLMYPNIHRNGYMNIEGSKADTSATIWSMDDIFKRRDAKKKYQQMPTTRAIAPAFVRMVSREKLTPPVPPFPPVASAAASDVHPACGSPQTTGAGTPSSISPTQPLHPSAQQTGAGSIATLSAENMAAHTEAFGGTRASPTSPQTGQQHSPVSVSPRDLDDLMSTVSGSEVEELPPANLGREAMWEWKMRQMEYEKALVWDQEVGHRKENCETIRK